MLKEYKLEGVNSCMGDLVGEVRREPEQKRMLFIFVDIPVTLERVASVARN
jgi:hypothetical protein